MCNRYNSRGNRLGGLSSLASDSDIVVSSDVFRSSYWTWNQQNAFCEHTELKNGRQLSKLSVVPIPLTKLFLCSFLPSACLDKAFLHSDRLCSFWRNLFRSSVHLLHGQPQPHRHFKFSQIWAPRIAFITRHWLNYSVLNLLINILFVQPPYIANLIAVTSRTWQGIFLYEVSKSVLASLYHKYMYRFSCLRWKYVCVI